MCRTAVAVTMVVLRNIWRCSFLTDICHLSEKWQGWKWWIFRKANCVSYCLFKFEGFGDVHNGSRSLPDLCHTGNVFSALLQRRSTTGGVRVGEGHQIWQSSHSPVTVAWRAAAKQTLGWQESTEASCPSPSSRNHVEWREMKKGYGSCGTNHAPSGCHREKWTIKYFLSPTASHLITFAHTCPVPRCCKQGRYLECKV